MRDILIQRLCEIRDGIGSDCFKHNHVVPENITNPATKRRWIARTNKQQEHLLPSTGYETMTDEELVWLFERAVARAYRQR